MAINYASRYSTQIDERFAKEAMSGPAVNQDYDFVGAKTVNVYSVSTAQMNDYTRSGSNRMATTAPTKLSEYKIHDNPPGINGRRQRKVKDYRFTGTDKW